jgi:hypothetical protein
MDDLEMSSILDTQASRPQPSQKDFVDWEKENLA